VWVGRARAHARARDACKEKQAERRTDIDEETPRARAHARTE
jgi:hypothetical protein